MADWTSSSLVMSAGANRTRSPSSCRHLLAVTGGPVEDGHERAVVHQQLRRREAKSGCPAGYQRRNTVDSHVFSVARYSDQDRPRDLLMMDFMTSLVPP